MNTLDSISIQPLSLEHADDLSELFGDIEVTKMFPKEVCTSVQELKESIQQWLDLEEKGQLKLWTVYEEKTSTAVGIIGFFDWEKEHRKAKLWYCLNRECWNKGIMTYVFPQAIDYGINKMELNRIEAQVLDINLPSKKLLKNHGFVLEGILREYEIWNDQFINIEVHSLINEVTAVPLTVNKKV